MQLQTASEMRAWRSVGRLSGLQPSASIWAWSWDPLRFARRHPPHHLSPARQIARQGTTPEVAQPPSSHHSNAPIGPECQSIPSNIVAHPYQSFRAFAQHGSCSAALRGGFWRCCTCGTGVRISSGAPNCYHSEQKHELVRIRARNSVGASWRMSVLSRVHLGLMSWRHRGRDFLKKPRRAVLERVKGIDLLLSPRNPLT
jgi:hypothetical protein